MLTRVAIPAVSIDRPIFKSNIPGSELAADGPVVRTDAESGKAVEELEFGNVPIQA